MSRPGLSPVRWTPPAPGPDRPDPLPPLTVVPVPGEGPEDVLVAPDGTVWTGLADGRVLRYRPDHGDLDVVVDTGGRPLGLEWLPDGRLLVCDARRGLLAVDVSARPAAVEVLATEAAGRPLVFCNNAAVLADGSVWFTDSSSRFGIDHWKGDILEHSGTGRLLRRDPSGAIEAVVTGLQFANGVAASPDGGFYAETGSYALSRWRRRADSRSPCVVMPPGFPTTRSGQTAGSSSARNSARGLADASVLCRLVWRCSEALQPARACTRVAAVDSRPHRARPRRGRPVGGHPA
jgi:streptogramin lyase